MAVLDVAKERFHIKITEAFTNRYGVTDIAEVKVYCESDDSEYTTDNQGDIATMVEQMGPDKYAMMCKEYLDGQCLDVENVIYEEKHHYENAY